MRTKPRLKYSQLDYTEIDFTPEQNNGVERIQFNTISQLIAKARLEKKPLILVEGKDDISIYETFVDLSGLKANIRAIETISGYGEGCPEVKRFIENAQPEIRKTRKNEKYLLGIIDRDTSYFRKEIKKRTKCLFVLNSYSFESHFVSKLHVEYAVRQFLVSSSQLNEETIDYIYSGFESKLETLFYLSLEALRHACNRSYKGLIGFSTTYGQIKNNSQLVREVLSKKEKLDYYAQLRKIPHNDLTIIKGKWLLEALIETTLEKIKTLSINCIEDTPIEGQERCPFCINDIVNKCSWSPKKHYDGKILKTLVLQYYDSQETSYIIDRLQKLG